MLDLVNEKKMQNQSSFQSRGNQSKIQFQKKDRLSYQMIDKFESIHKNAHELSQIGKSSFASKNNLQQHRGTAMINGKTIFALQESFSELNYFIQSIIGDLDQIKDFIDQQLQKPKDGQTDRSISDKDQAKKARQYDKKQFLQENHQLTNYCRAKRFKPANKQKTRPQIPSEDDQDSLKQQKNDPEIDFTQNQSQKRNKVVNFITERRYVEAYFKTKFHDLFEITNRKDAKVLKLTFRKLFIRWLIDKKLLPKKLRNLTSDDKMLIQRLLTLYIKDNYNDKCTFQGKHYIGMNFKLPEKI